MWENKNIVTINCFLPCRKGSERVVQKNTRKFGKYEFGLTELKLKQLLDTPEIDYVIMSTDDDEIIDYCASIKSKKLIVHRRDGCLASSSTSTDELVGHAASLIAGGDILWTHVTSPFISSKVYSNAINQYRLALEQGYDSLMSTSPIQGFLWNENGPINYDRNIEKWPRTQTLPIIHEINSGIFLADRTIYKEMNDRIGQRPFMFELDELTAMDIDWPDDFRKAELILSERNGFY